MSDVEVSVVLPAYNEEETIERTVEVTLDALASFLPAGSYEVIVAEDGCEDRTPELAAELAAARSPVRHVHADERLGRGGALEYAFDEATGETLVYFDTDLATDMRHLEELVESVRSGEYDLVTGSRWLPGSDADRPATRGVPSQWFNRFVRLFLRSDLRDHQCGFKAFDREALFDVLAGVEDDHWFWDTEVLVRAQRAGYRVREFPVEWTPRGDSKVDIVRDVLGMGSQIMRTWWQLSVSPRVTRRVSLAAGSTLVVLAVLLMTVYLNPGDVIERMAGADPALILLAGAVYVLSWPLRGLRYRDILSELGYTERVSFLTGAVFISQTGNLVFPARAGDGVRAYVMKARRSIPYPSGFASLAVERVFDLLTITALAGAVVLGFVTSGNGAELSTALTGSGLSSDSAASGRTALVVAGAVGVAAILAAAAIVASARSSRNYAREAVTRLSSDAYADYVAGVVEQFAGDVQTVARDRLYVTGELLDDARHVVRVGVGTQPRDRFPGVVAARPRAGHDGCSRQDGRHTDRSGDDERRPSAGGAVARQPAPGERRGQLCAVSARHEPEDDGSGESGDREQVEHALDGQRGEARGVGDRPARLHHVGADAVARPGRKDEVAGLADEDGPGQKADTFGVPEFREDIPVPESAKRPGENVDGAGQEDQRWIGARHPLYHVARVQVDCHQQHREHHESAPGGQRHASCHARAHRELPPRPHDLAPHPEDVPDDVDLRVASRRPLDGELPDAVARPLCANQYLGVPEPVVVLHAREHVEQRLAVERLEPALVVAEIRPQEQAHEPVEPLARDSARGRPVGVAAGQPPRARHQVVLAGPDALDELLEVAHVRRQVRVEVDQRLARGLVEGVLQGPAAAQPLVGVDVSHRRTGRRELGGQLRRPVLAAVLGDDHLVAAGREKRGERVERHLDGPLDRLLLVVSGEDDAHLDVAHWCRLCRL